MDNTHTHRLHELLRVGSTPPRVYAAIDPAARHTITACWRTGQRLPPGRADSHRRGQGGRIRARHPHLRRGTRTGGVPRLCGRLHRGSGRPAAGAGGKRHGRNRHDPRLYSPACAALLAAHRLTAALVSADHARRMSDAACAAGVRVRAHIALDTGMNRIGLAAHSPAELESAVREAADIPALPGLRVDGMFSHFAEADADGDAAAMQAGSRTMTQYARFAQVRDALAARGLRPGLCHICNSAAAVRFPAAHPTHCRTPCGWASACTAMACRSRTGRRSCPSCGCYLGRASAYTAARRTRRVRRHLHRRQPRLLATLPVGYADGWIRALPAPPSRYTAEGDRQAPLVGRICMDQCMADVTGLPVRVGDRSRCSDRRRNSWKRSRHAPEPFPTNCSASSRHASPAYRRETPESIFPHERSTP